MFAGPAGITVSWKVTGTRPPTVAVTVTCAWLAVLRETTFTEARPEPSVVTVDDPTTDAGPLLTMKFKTFLNGLMRLPCQIVRTGRRIVYRLLSWTPWQEVLLRAVDTLRLPLRC